ncbi:MAG: TolB family protein [Armatimonadota bacterium]
MKKLIAVLLVLVIAVFAVIFSLSAKNRSSQITLTDNKVIASYRYIGGSIFDPLKVYSASDVLPGKAEVAVCNYDSLHVIDPRTGRNRTLLNMYCFLPEWSPDGRQIACSASRGSSWAERSVNWEILLIDLPTGGVRTLAKTLRTDKLCWSPDGKYLAWIKLQPNMLVVTSVSTGEHILRLDPEEDGLVDYTDIAWNPKSNELLYSGDALNGKGILAVRNIATGAERIISDRAVCRISWSPKGDMIAVRFMEQRPISKLENGFDILSPDGKRLDHVNMKNLSEMCWSPDGRGMLVSVHIPNNRPVAPGSWSPNTCSLYWVPLRGKPHPVIENITSVKRLQWPTENDIIVESYGEIRWLTRSKVSTYNEY